MASDYLYRLWDQGQRQLAAGRYVAARGNLEAAEALAVRQRDLHALARIYLPLLEVRRLIRYRAAEGRILILKAENAECSQVKVFLEQHEGTLLIGPAAGGRDRALRLARRVVQTARRTGHCLEAVLLPTRRGAGRIAAPEAPTFGAGIPIRWTEDAGAEVGPSTDPALVLPLPVVSPMEGSLDGRTGLGALAREALLIAWEALALRWQGQHPLAAKSGAWEEFLWLRAALRIDPACEPIAMRLIAVAEGLERCRAS